MLTEKKLIFIICVLIALNVGAIAAVLQRPVACFAIALAIAMWLARKVINDAPHQKG